MFFSFFGMSIYIGKGTFGMMMNNDIESQVASVFDLLNGCLDKYDKNPSDSRSSEVCIYRIPKNLRELNEAAYTPQAVSIGPIYNEDFQYVTMNVYKVGYLHAFLQQTKTSLNDFIIFIVEQERRVVNCYEDNVIDGFMSDFTSQHKIFCSMLLLDGIFIIEYLIKARDTFGGALHGKPLFEPTNIGPDLILLENQLPFFLLDGLYNLAFPDKGNGIPSSFLELACDYFNSKNYIKLGLPQVKHFTDLYRNLCLPHHKLSNLRTLQPDGTKEAQWPKSASVLLELGVKFRVAPRGRALCDIQFNHGVLEIPCLTFQSSTESLFRNLMAFEQCHYPYETYICHYLFFMDNLINTAKDVDILVEKGIIINWLGDNEAVADLANRISKKVVVDGYGLYAEVCVGLNKHCEVGWNSWKVSFKRDYLSTPWKIASTIAALILLVLTAIQTICSIISLVRM